jgi:hypothetical protein
MPNQFDYAIVRAVPRVERSEFINVGVILFCRSRRFLEARFELDLKRWQAFAPDFDTNILNEQFAIIQQVCQGGAGSGYIGQLSQAERWHWLVAPRSTIIQTSPAHAGLCSEPDTAIELLLATMVRIAS